MVDEKTKTDEKEEPDPKDAEISLLRKACAQQKEQIEKLEKVNQGILQYHYAEICRVQKTVSEHLTRLVESARLAAEGSNKSEGIIVSR